ncbi:MAG TPA: hypothetical protein VNT27_17370 [Propionibacteriaceae bacterium]|nr:hypothetical protein [Propionibacteriaceae bacterium]
MTWPDSEPRGAVQEGPRDDRHCTGVPRSAAAGGRPGLVDAELADQLLAKAEAQGVELLGPDGLLSQVTKMVLERALARS